MIEDRKSVRIHGSFERPEPTIFGTLCIFHKIIITKLFGLTITESTLVWSISGFLGYARWVFCAVFLFLV